MGEIMVARDTAWPDGTPCWVDLGVADIARATAFYAGLFGWDIQPGPPEAGGYTMCLLTGRPVAGIGPQQGPPGTPPAWTTYLAADDADETAAKITKAGGQLFMDPFDVMDVGRMAVAADPGGAVFGIWQARAHTGVGLANEPGALCWNENHTRDFDQNKAFYQAVFGYEPADLEGAGIRYATLKLGGREVAGIMELDASVPASVPAHWETYFAVAGTDAAVAAVQVAGGAVVRPPWDTPYGRMAIVTDDQGAEFSVITQPGG
jgi:predicted enzyme related to lactoylglutathione lyase